ncbi:MAG: acetyl-CoA C-acyltransferase, partial [Halioglobus sp.]|nr:acetyl-CoA C-acyltransferase [Halioglobus sp.]
AIAAGRAELVLAGGTEALSHAPVLLPEDTVAWLARWYRSGTMERVRLLAQIKPAFLSPVIGLAHGLTDPICGLGMGQTAEILRYRFSIARTDADRYALRSHQRLAAAQSAGFLDEIEPMFSPDGRCHRSDEGLRPDSTLEQLGALEPAFERPFGEVTAGNSSQITDGACWLVLASAQALERHDLTPLARIVDSQWAALPPAIMGLGPVFACTALLQRRQLAFEDIAFWEINEAFAAQVLACVAAWEDTQFCREHLGLAAAPGGIAPDRLNVDGGAISLGHPVGTSGARIVLHLARILQRAEARYGVASECIGGGQGGAMLLERP